MDLDNGNGGETSISSLGLVLHAEEEDADVLFFCVEHETPTSLS